MAIKIGNQVTHIGLVLEVSIFATTFNDGYDHTSAATVWNMDSMRPESITYACSMPGNVNGTAEVDADATIQELYEIYKHNRRMDNIALTANSEIYAQVGDTIKVVKGKKCPRGVIGEVIRKQETQYGNRYVIRDAKNEYVLWENNYEVIARPLASKPKDLEFKKPYPSLAIVKWKLAA